MDQWLVLKIDILPRNRENKKSPKIFFLLMTELLFLDMEFNQ